MEIGKKQIEMLWGKIESELLRQKCDRQIGEMLLPPAEAINIVKFEEAIGVPLPADYKLSLAIHEGVKYWVWLWDAVSIPEITQVLDFWKSNIEASSHSNNQGVQLISQGAVRRSMFDKLWIPVANDNGIPICLDLIPFLIH